MIMQIEQELTIETWKIPTARNSQKPGTTKMLTQKTCSEEKLHKLVNEAKTLEVATWLLKSRRSDLAGQAAARLRAWLRKGVLEDSPATGDKNSQRKPNLSGKRNPKPANQEPLK